jgi:hypothetical protein
MGALPAAYGHAGDFLGLPLVPGDTGTELCVAVVLNEKYRPPCSPPTAPFVFFPAYATVVCLPARCIGGPKRIAERRVAGQTANN